MHAHDVFLRGHRSGLAEKTDGQGTGQRARCQSSCQSGERAPLKHSASEGAERGEGGRRESRQRTVKARARRMIMFTGTSLNAATSVTLREARRGGEGGKTEGTQQPSAARSPQSERTRRDSPHCLHRTGDAGSGKSAAQPSPQRAIQSGSPWPQRPAAPGSGLAAAPATGPCFAPHRVGTGKNRGGARQGAAALGRCG